MNKFRQILSVLLLLFTCACAPHITPTSSTSTSIITLNIVNTPTIVKTITPTATKQSTPTPTITYIPTPSFTPTSTIQVAEKLCPSQRERAIIDIGLDMSTRLIFRDDTNSNLWSISADNPEPVSIPNIQPNGIIFYGISISPNNQWFAYYVFKEKKNSLAYYDIWVSSMDGLKQWQVLADNPGGFIIKWINENLIELWHYPDRSFTCPERIISVNPFTLETKIPETLPVNYDCLRGFILNPENTKAIYIHKKNWEIFDFSSRKSQVIFPWLSGHDLSPATNQNFNWDQKGLSMIFPRSNQIDYLQNLPIQSLSDSTISMQSIFLPMPGEIWNKDINLWLPDKGLVGLELIEEGIIFDWLNEMPSTKFVTLDLYNSIWTDYCLDRADIKNKRGQPSYENLATSDGRFLSWTVMEMPGNHHPLGTIILDLETGNITILEMEGYEFLGWGEVNQ